MKNLNKKSLSQVIATILLILLSVAAVAILSAAIIPFIKTSLEEGKECFDAKGLLEISTESEYTCYTGEEDGEITASVMVKRGMKDIEIKGIRIAIFGGGTGKSFDVPGSSDVEMIGGEVELPGKGEERTYSITLNDLDEVEYIEIAPILQNGRMCDSTGKVEIESC